MGVFNSVALVVILDMVCFVVGCGYLCWIACAFFSFVVCLMQVVI